MPSPVPNDGQALSRRLRTVPGVLIGAVIAVPLLIIGLPLAVLFDLVRGKFRLPWPRILLFGAWYLAWEVFAVTAAGVLWIATGFGAGLRAKWSQNVHSRLQQAWAHSLMGMMGRLLDLRIEVTGLEEASAAPAVLYARHASLVDTLLPLHLLGPKGIVFRYVLKTELLWDPALDIVGHRFPNYFVDRSGSDSARELARISELAAGTGPNEMFVIFPEGSRFTPAKRERAMDKLEASDPELAAVAANYVTTMPPRPGGALAALTASPPEADVVILAHTGLEGLAGLKELVATVPFRHPVQIALWRIPRAAIPTDAEARRRWLFDEWGKVDAWVVEHRAD